MNREELISEIRKIEIVSRMRSPFSLSGSYRSALKGSGIETAGFKEYSPDDDFRSIDWNMSARSGKTYTRLFQEEREIPLFFIIDISPSMYTGGSHKKGRRSKIETSSLVLASLAFSAVFNRDKAGAVFCTDSIKKEIPMMKDPRHIADMVFSLIDFDPGYDRSSRGKKEKGVSGQNTFDISNALSAIPSESLRKGSCFIISDFKSPVPAGKLNSTGRKTDLIFIRITDPSDTFIPGGFSFSPFTSGDRGKGCYISFMKKDREMLSGSAEKYISEQRQLIINAGIPLIDISTDSNIFSTMNTFFRQRRR